MADEKKKAHPSIPKTQITEGLPICVRAKGDEELSGVQWCKRFATSRSTDDLVEPFKSAFCEFLAAIVAAGASASIAATYRPKERAYLMHYCWLIKNKVLEPRGIPPFPGVKIRWDHDDDVDSIHAAAAMCSGYKINELKIMPALSSQHTLGLAVDVNISWVGDLVISKKDKNAETIASLPRSGMNGDLHKIAEEYGVMKYFDGYKDPPHWSSTGR